MKRKSLYIPLADLVEQFQKFLAIQSYVMSLLSLKGLFCLPLIRHVFVLPNRSLISVPHFEPMTFVFLNFVSPIFVMNADDSQYH